MRTVTEINKLARVLRGVPVLGCIPGSPSHRAGIKYGDILLEANGHRTTDLDSYLRARDLRKDEIRLVVFRDGTNKTLDLQLQHYKARESDVRTFFEENDSLVRLSIEPTSTGEGSDGC